MINGVKGVMLILAFLALGEVVSHFIYNFIPGNVIGMVLLFMALQFKVVNPHSVEYISLFLVRNMALFFVPAGVGLMVTYRLLGEHWLSITLATVLSTFLVIATVGHIQQKFGKK